ncbi:MAG: CpsD/CapB family tyrosine-protein kinase [Planctomycetota bacterium]
MHESLTQLEPLIDAVWTQIASHAQGRAHTRVLVTSPSPKAGTSLITAATGAALARNLRSQVLVVETNLKHPGLAGFTGIEGLPGFSDMLLGHADLESVTREVPGVSGLYVIPAGTPRAAIPGEFATRPAQDLFRSLATRCRFVLFDAPPLLEHREARTLMSFSDHVLLVLRARESSKADTTALVDLVRKSGVPLLGTVLNRHVSELGFLDR